MSAFQSTLRCAIASTAVLAFAALPITSSAAPKTAKAVSKSHAKAHKKPAPKPVEVDPAEATPEQIAAAEKVYYGNYECEFKQTVGIEKDPKYPAYVEVRNGKSHWLMKPVVSSTGAIRLEDVKGETLMVQISSKSMLLNVKTAQRIVDDCVGAQQRELTAAAQAKAAELSANGITPVASPPLLLATPGAQTPTSAATDAAPLTTAATPTK